MNTEFESSLQKYADLIVHIGLNVQRGQRLLVRAPIQTAPLVTAVARSAYRAGARLVDTLWTYDQVTLARYQNAPRDSFEEFPAWMAQLIESYAHAGDPILSIYAENPELLKDQDPELVMLASKTAARHASGYLTALTRNEAAWCVVSLPVPSWAAKVFPAEAAGEQEARLWEQIFQVIRLDQPDPVQAWEAHLSRLAKNAAYLTGKAYTALHYRAPGTDLTIGLPHGHIWKGGRAATMSGLPFTPNLPTEEVFTLPHKARVDGVVSSTRPLSYAGNLIHDFSLTFKDGRVVDVKAASGENFLRKLVETDEGSHYLGEVALVPNSSPISQSGVLFYNTLYDENAACHLALGEAYKDCLEGGVHMSDEEFGAAGGNKSLEHEDFMIGSAELDIDGICADGSREPVMRSGEWAFTQ